MKYILFFSLLVFASQGFAQTSDSVELRKQAQADIDSMNKVLTAHPEDDSTRLWLADTYYNIGAWSEAQTEYETFLKRNPDNFSVRIDYSLVLEHTTGSYERPIAELKKVLAHDSNDVRALYDLGIDYIQSNTKHPFQAVADAMPYLHHAQSAARKQKDYEMYGKISVYIARVEDIVNGK